MVVSFLSPQCLDLLSPRHARHWWFRRARDESSHGTVAEAARFDPSRPLAFMHVPKTGGTSIAVALQSALEPCRAIRGFDRVLFGDYADFRSLDDSVSREIHLSAETLPAADLIAAHVARSSFEHRYPDVQLMTVLREPFSRLLSLWLFWRSHSDEQLAPWGSWGDRLRLSRLPLAAFLSSREVACQTDNVVVRMLLWPRRLIPDGDFIVPRHDDRLLAAAQDVLARFAVADVVENPRLSERLQRWLDRPVALERKNQTGGIPAPLRNCLATELTAEACDLLALRSRLDLELWSDIARSCMPARDPAQLREQTTLRNVAHYATLMA